MGPGVESAGPMKRLILLFLLLSMLPALAQEPVLRVRGATWPGGALFVSVESDDYQKGTWFWAGRSGALTPAPYGLRAGLAVPLDASVGGAATLRLELTKADGEKVELSKKITIANKWRPTQYLSMSSSNEAKYSDPQADREEELVLAALRDLDPGARWDGDFQEPSGAPRSSPFGVRRVRNGRTAGFHRGLDYAGGVGEPVEASAGGVVTLVGRNYVILGNCIIVNHGEGLTSLYLHLSRVDVKEGQTVKPGQVIGRIGNTGASTGPHLHYATYFHGEPIDPDILLDIPDGWAPAR